MTICPQLDLTALLETGLTSLKQLQDGSQVGIVDPPKLREMVRTSRSNFTKIEEYAQAICRSLDGLQKEIDALAVPPGSGVAGLPDTGGVGIVVQTAPATTTFRTLTSPSGTITIGNPDGVAGNPTLDANVGAVAGTVAAGDDPRFADAAAGLALAAPESELSMLERKFLLLYRDYFLLLKRIPQGLEADLPLALTAT